MNITVNFINAFSQYGKGGNPAAVVLDADHLSAEERQRLAYKTGLSETAFVSRSKTADFKLDFYTPLRQIAHCGHATIATFSYLRQNGMLAGKAQSSKETIDGNRNISLIKNEVFMEQQAPTCRMLMPDDLDFVAHSLGLDAFCELPLIVNTGNAFLIVEVANEDVLLHLRPNFQMIQSISEKYDLIGYYVFCRTDAVGLDATARMFAPAYGIREESATGMAAGPLACYLFSTGLRKDKFAIEQGKLMTPPSPSSIKVDLLIDKQKIKSLLVGGTATLVEQKTIQI
ncbi:MAG: PhzF family phenazine biosynthesis protein [Pedobacter sp.]|nr:PhzF family phenazine biosynthesis protein [Pedobacter sp.]MDQ8052612.1 PhzF family phenazine biosynthesis protein [Pedobacter sp.]